MPRKKPPPAARHPSEAMAKFDRLLLQMAPRAEPSPGERADLPKRGKRRVSAERNRAPKIR